MEIAIAAKLTNYLQQRVAFRKGFGALTCSDEECLKRELLYCAAFRLAKLTKASNGQLKWRGTRRLTKELEGDPQYVCRADKADLCDAYSRDMTAMTFTLEATIGEFLSCALEAECELPVPPTPLDVLVWWAGSTHATFSANKWNPFRWFYFARTDDLPDLPKFRHWVAKQFSNPILSGSLERVVNGQDYSWSVHNMNIWRALDLCYRDAEGLAESYYMRPDRLAWRVVGNPQPQRSATVHVLHPG